MNIPIVNSKDSNSSDPRVDSREGASVSEYATAGALKNARAAEAAKIREAVCVLREARQARQVSHASAMLRGARNAHKLAAVARDMHSLLRASEYAKQAIAGAD